MDLQNEIPQTERLDSRKPADIARAADLLRAGGLVAFPTETVYGLGANALDPDAVAGIFVAKQRPSWDPLIVHISDHDMLAAIATGYNQDRVARLIAAFWPGPLTLLLPRSPIIPDAVTASRLLVGVRMPAHPVALELIRQTGVPLAAPSANRFGHTSPTTAAHVLADLDGRIDAVLDAGPTAVGLESTVVEITPDCLLIYRPGAITINMLQDTLKETPVRLYAPPSSSDPIESLPSPGVSLRHYAPKARVVLVDLLEAGLPEIDRPEEGSSVFGSLFAELQGKNEQVGIMLPDYWVAPEKSLVFPWGLWSDKQQLAQRLFAGLRALDDRGATIILCPLPSPEGLGAAIRDRLQKGATP